MEIKKHYACFSAAIRDGATIRPQGYGCFLDNGKSCALGAGAEAVFGQANNYDAVCLLYPYLQQEGGPCPECGAGDGSYMASILYHLNDTHKWTREAVADWLEAEEGKLKAVPKIQETASLKAGSNAQVTA